MEDEFTENDWFVWPAGHTDYADLTANAEGESEDEEGPDEDNPEGK